MVMPIVSPEKSADPTYNFYFDLLRLQSVFKASSFWVNAEKLRAKRVARYRAYYDGDHDFTLNQFMMDLLRIKDPDEGMALNVMPTVVDTKADRCIVQSIDAVLATNNTQTQAQSEEESVLKDPRKNPSAWIQELMEANRFDILQGEVHQAAIRDSDSFLMLTWDEVEKQVRWTFEEAYDGFSGMLAYYPSRNVPKMAAAIKVWQIDEPGSLSTFQLATRVNIYFPDRIEKYITQGMGRLMPFIDPEHPNPDAAPGQEHIWDWTDRQGEPLGIPVVHFPNGGRHNYGVSRLRNAISPQNALNRFHYSSIMTAEFTAFSILVATGHDPADGGIVPGMIYVVNKSPLEAGQTADLTRLGGGDMKPILDALTNERHLIADITRTPSPDLMGGGSSNKSGEMLKQLEIGLLGEIRQFQVRIGVCWEMVADQSWKIQAAFSVIQPPPYKRFMARWRPAEIRDNAQVVQSAVLMTPIWGNEQTMHAVSSVFENLDEDTIAKITAQQKADKVQEQAMAVMANTPTPQPAQPAQAQPAALTDTVNPGKGTVKVSEPSETITADGVQQQGQPAPNSVAQSNQPANPQQAAPSKPVVRGKKLPTEQALKVNPITDEELSVVGAMHRKFIGKKS